MICEIVDEKKRKMFDLIIQHVHTRLSSLFVSKVELLNYGFDSHRKQIVGNRQQKLDSNPSKEVICRGMRSS